MIYSIHGIYNMVYFVHDIYNMVYSIYIYISIYLKERKFKIILFKILFFK